ncbi:MAG: hypothetical protein WAL67_12145 [Candidatus Cybelea sp.]
MKQSCCIALTTLLLIAPVQAGAASSAPQPMSALRWRSIGPYIGGRVVAVAGVESEPDLFYMGGVQGGVWRSADYGQDWENITDGKIPGVAESIGAIAVAPSNPDVIYVGTGEADIRQDFDTGDGIYRSVDRGKTWSYAGLRNTRTTMSIVVDPQNPNVIYAASMGHVFAPNPERGVFKSENGGKTWRKVLFVDDKTGGVDLAIDPRDPRVLYAAMWQAQRYPWALISGGPGSGLYKSTDAGAHWMKISTHPGFATGLLGKIGVAVSARDPRVVYAIVQANDGGVFRSDDGGATWRHVNDEMKLRQRAFYYTAIFADPGNPREAYAPQVDGLYKTTDGGKTWETISPGCDNHTVWINPRNTKILLQGSDCGAQVSVDGGDHWSTTNNQPTGQFYHVALDDQFPFHVYGAQQDQGAFEGPTAALGGNIGLAVWYPVAAGESTFVAPKPGQPDVTFGSGYYSAFVWMDRITGQEQNVSPWPRYLSGFSTRAQQYRFGWTHPIFFSPADSRELLLASQVVFSSQDAGKTWKILSPDLTRDVASTEGSSGGPISYDITGAETFPDISSLAASPLDADLLWAGSADGLVHLTTDHGAHWKVVTPPQLPQWAQISSIQSSYVNKGTAYLTASRYMWDDYHPYVFETTDYGEHWTAIDRGLPEDQYVFTVRQDPREPRLLFTTTRSTVYVSLDGGANWQPLSLNLPGVQVRDLAIETREGELVAATHGRGFWILDNLALLEQLAAQTAYSPSQTQLFAPQTAWLTKAYGSSPAPYTGTNPDYGAAIFFNLPESYDGRTPLTLSFLDAKGATIRAFALHLKAAHVAKLTPAEVDRLDAYQARRREYEELTSVAPGMNAFQWDLRYPPAFDPPGWRTVGTDDWPDSGDGPTILPGSYTVVLRYGEQRLQAPLTLKLDPRVHPAAGDLEARLALEQQILQTTDNLDHAVAAAMSARTSLAPDKRAEVDAEIGKLVQLDIHSSEADTMVPDLIRAQLGFLLNSLEGAYVRPTSAQYATYQQLKAIADDGIATLESLTARG